MKLYSEQERKDQKVVTVCGIKVYQKEDCGEGAATVTRIYLGGLVRTVIENAELKKIYVLGVKVRESILPIQHSKINAILRRINDVYFNMQVLVQIPVIHRYFTQYRNCNAGKDIIFIAGGPTALYFNNQKCGGIKCGVNGIISIVDDLNYLFIEDTFLHDKNLNKEIDQYQGNNCQKFYGILPSRRVQFLNRRVHNTDRISPIHIKNGEANVFLLEDVVNGKWAIDLEVEAFGDFCGAALSALQFLLYTHPKRIYLVGNDCTNQKLAYHSDRPHNGNHAPKIRGYKIMKQVVESIYPDVEIISVNPVGLKGIFKDVYTQSYLKEHPEIDGNKHEIIQEEKIM